MSETATVSVTHHIRVDGEDSWVRFERTIELRDGSADEDWLIEHVSAKAIEACVQISDDVMEHNNAVR